jgi:hypothetical protein
LTPAELTRGFDEKRAFVGRIDTRHPLPHAAENPFCETVFSADFSSLPPARHRKTGGCSLVKHVAECG